MKTRLLRAQYFQSGCKVVSLGAQSHFNKSFEKQLISHFPNFNLNYENVDFACFFDSGTKLNMPSKIKQPFSLLEPRK